MIIEQHHGSVGVESYPGQGSTFWFTLPLIENESESESGQNVEDLNALL